MAILTPFQKHLEERGLTTKYKYWIDETSEVVTFPLFVGQVWSGFQRYAHKFQKIRCNGDGVNVRYFTHVSPAYKPISVFGWEYLLSSGPIYLFDGIFDSIRCINTGRSALAFCGDSPDRSVIQWVLMKTYGRMLINITDNDENQSGKRLAKYSDRDILCESGFKDLGEMSHDQANNFLLSIEQEL